MKIDFRRIIKDHIYTLKDGDNGKILKLDIFLFFILPLIVAAISAYFKPTINRDFYNVSITFFGIFIALLLNIQVAIFGIFQRNWEKLADTRLQKMQDNKLDWKKALAKEINSNISYLILVSCIGLFLLIGLYIFETTSYFWVFLVVSIYGHFLLTLLMIVKRSHALFQAEYS